MAVGDSKQMNNTQMGDSDNTSTGVSSTADTRRGGAARTMLPTTKAQVSGHKFLRRRVEHGVVTGDIRMIHDPLASRRRALIFGTVATVLIGAGAGVLAWLSPEPDPGDATIVRSDHGQLYTLLDGRYHPTANLASARLLAGAPDDPVAVGADHLAEHPQGIPIGIPDAPDNLPNADDLSGGQLPIGAADSSDAASLWAGCIDYDTAAVSVVADNPQQTMLLDSATDNTAALVESASKQWLVSASGRVEIPNDDSSFSRALRRGLGITPQTPVWQAPPEILANWSHLPAWQIPADDNVPELLEIDAAGENQWWAIVATEEDTRGTVVPLTQTQAQILQEIGATTRSVTPTALNKYADAGVDADLNADANADAVGQSWNLPEQAPDFLSADDGQICAAGQGAAGQGAVGELAVLTIRDSDSNEKAAHSQPDNNEATAGDELMSATTVELPGDVPADYFVTTRTFSHGIVSEHGYHLLTPAGWVHDVASAEDLQSLGTAVIDDEPAAEEVSWDLLRLLPHGPGLDKESARQVRH